MAVLEAYTDRPHAGRNPLCRVVNIIETCAPLGQCTRDLVHDTSAGETSVISIMS